MAQQFSLSLSDREILGQYQKQAVPSDITAALDKLLSMFKFSEGAPIKPEQPKPTAPVDSKQTTSQEAPRKGKPRTKKGAAKKT
jgi:hypothetical protein